MSFDPQKHHRHSIRLKGFNYHQHAAYFVTLVTQSRECLFGEITNGNMVLNATGKMIVAAWTSMKTRFAGIDIDEFVVMPNHFHAVIVIENEPIPDVGAALVAAQIAGELVPGSGTGAGMSPSPTGIDANTRTELGDIIGAFKSISTHDIILAVRRGEIKPFTGKIWQRNYYEHIIQDDRESERISLYINENPASWSDDAEFPEVRSVDR